MKVLQIMPEFGMGGAETMCENLVYALVDQNIEVVVVSLFDYHSVITDRLEANGIRVIYLNKRLGLDPKVIGQLKRVFKEEKPDVVHTHRNALQYAAPAAYSLGIKSVVHTVHNVAKKENGKLSRIVNKFFFKHFNAVPVALSEEVLGTIIEEYKLRRSQVPVILNGINLDKCIEKTNYTCNESFYILHVGRFSEQKNHLGLIEAFEMISKEITGARLLLIGDGELKNVVEELVKAKHLESRVEFLGLQDNVYEYLNKADVFVLPSLYEGVPMSLIEAMGTALPIVATGVGGVPDMLENDRDAILTAVDNREVAKAVVRLARDEKLREQMGKNAKKRSVEFSSQTMAKKYSEVYRG